MLARLVLRGTDMRISRLPMFPIIHVLNRLLDGGMQPLRGSLLEREARLREVRQDPDGFGIAHLVFAG